MLLVGYSEERQAYCSTLVSQADLALEVCRQKSSPLYLTGQ